MARGVGPFYQAIFRWRALAVLGFQDATVTIHAQPYQGRKGRLFTVVARRIRPLT